jgi:hypothetical protein
MHIMNRTFLFRSSDRANPYFVLQRRRGHDEQHAGFASLFVATIDSVFDSKVNISFRRHTIIVRSLRRHIATEFFINGLIQKSTIVIMCIIETYRIYSSCSSDCRSRHKRRNRRELDMDRCTSVASSW